METSDNSIGNAPSGNEFTFNDKFTEKEASELLKLHLDRALEQEQVVINLSSIKKMDTAGVQTILLLKHLCEDNNIDCLFTPLQDETLRTLMNQNGLLSLTESWN